MIDEKKIEETAKEYAFKKDLFLQGGYVIGFKAGINWFLDNLWHDASEEPEKNRELLVEHHQLGAKDLRFRVLTTKENTKWSDRVANFLITRWLYIEDLMKGGK